ncbi:MAG: S41 family peptidase, partial [Flavobacteriales bacterium]|nr:S41 family peptidase [Flavobacteriales bacterium]
IYTNPIVTNGAYLWSSENNILLFEQYVDNPNIPEETRRQIQAIVTNGKANPNSFVLLGESETDTITLEEIRAYPKKVSIIIDKECTSATEEFLLKAKQSSKTTIYGYESSGGALDYSNLNAVITPSGYWYATVPTTRSSRLPEYPVDPHGIAPDVLVDREVKDLIMFIINKNR